MNTHIPKREKRRPEPFQKGNPYQLTFDQHFLQRKSIERFCQNGGVEVQEKNPRRLRRRPSCDTIFCAKRVWDQISEVGFMHRIEITYQNIATSILNGQTYLNENDCNAITDFYLLWNLRQRATTNPPKFPETFGYKPERLVIEKDEQEKLEKAGIFYWNKDGRLPDHVAVGTRLQMEIWAERERMKGTKWGIFTIKPFNGEFLVPDRLSEHSALPLSPSICLVAGYFNRLVDFSFVAQYNGLAVANAENFYFARELKNCPMLRHAKLVDELNRAELLRYERRFPR